MSVACLCCLIEFSLKRKCRCILSVSSKYSALHKNPTSRAGSFPPIKLKIYGTIYRSCEGFPRRFHVTHFSFSFKYPSVGSPSLNQRFTWGERKGPPPYLNCILGVFLAHNRKYIRICIFLLLRHLKKNKSTPFLSPGWTYIPNCNFPSFFFWWNKKRSRKNIQRSKCCV